ncbi:hypothetical protein ACN38_g3260 [Penicillium nordicum]|uniref:Uncharacterized protein n=1 Tax=Penicillium nordicum TaxID=229535 RepID=A0A0M8P5X9_9EURO|nr:hypothetical protein ACN38_g3260 [Penicillium nordicum]
MGAGNLVLAAFCSLSTTEHAPEYLYMNKRTTKTRWSLRHRHSISNLLWCFGLRECARVPARGYSKKKLRCIRQACLYHHPILSIPRTDPNSFDYITIVCFF